ncbi:VOC family protein [Sphingobium sp. R-21]|uniref:VOC family protein n=1 Tax=Sphingobium sp. R-21 TaxID=3404056 RepID=UPI003CE7BF1D
MHEIAGSNEEIHSSSTERAVITLPFDVHAIDHVAIAVSNLEGSLEIYCGILGFTEIERRITRGQSTGMHSAVLRKGKAVVVLVQGVEPDSQVSRFVERFGEGVQHIAFEVSDLDEAIRHAEANGLRSETGLLEDHGIRQTFLERRAGVGPRIELIERRGGKFTDDSVERLFRAMEEANLV